MSDHTVITEGFGSFGSDHFVITEGFSSAVIAEGKQGVFGLEDGMNSTIFGRVVVR